MEFAVNELKDYLKVQTKNDYYKEYKNFKRFILNPAVEEVSKNTELTCSFIELKNGLSVERIVFKLELKEGYTEKLVNMGVIRAIAAQLIADFGDEKIEQAIKFTEKQIDTLNVKNPALLIVAAIKKNHF